MEKKEVGGEKSTDECPSIQRVFVDNCFELVY